jgi:hypothetical protein
MSENANVKDEEKSADTSVAAGQEQAGEKAQWQKPTLEDVSEEVMAQPYIRFT